MSQPQGPWHRPDRPRRLDPRIKRAIWIAALILLGIGLWQLSMLFPGGARSDIDHAYIIQGVAIVALISSGLVFGRQIRASEAMRNIALWVGIAAILMIGYAYKDVLSDVAYRVRAELVPSYGVSPNPHELVLTADENGQFSVIGAVDNVRVKFLVDTGASDIVLSPDDAQRLGIELDKLDYSRDYETANGEGRGAPFTVASLTIGPIRLTDVPVSINQAPMSSSLLGAPFFQRLQSFEIRGRRLYLRTR